MQTAALIQVWITSTYIACCRPKQTWSHARCPQVRTALADRSSGQQGTENLEITANKQNTSLSKLWYGHSFHRAFLLAPRLFMILRDMQTNWTPCPVVTECAFPVRGTGRKMPQQYKCHNGTNSSEHCVSVNYKQIVVFNTLMHLQALKVSNNSQANLLQKWQTTHHQNDTFCYLGVCNNQPVWESFISYAPLEPIRAEEPAPLVMSTS